MDQLYTTLNEFYNFGRHFMKKFNVFNNPSIYLYKIYWCSVNPCRGSRQIVIFQIYDKFCVVNIILTLLHLLVLSCDLPVNARTWITQFLFCCMLKASRFTSVKRLVSLTLLDTSAIDQSLANLLPEYWMTVKKGLKKVFFVHSPNTIH